MHIDVRDGLGMFTLREESSFTPSLEEVKEDSAGRVRVFLHC